MSRETTIKNKLAILRPHILEVIDESTQHQGHSGNPDGAGESHFSVKIASIELDDLTRIEKHRVINELLSREFASGLHALSIEIIPS
ncbi:MAG: BolA family transcriptional regulator [Rickettsiales bacterium]|nr:MAG: BolA family transcriptional regulator [Rickettsiales bacterium]